jgi:hypothetical protein
MSVTHEQWKRVFMVLVKTITQEYAGNLKICEEIWLFPRLFVTLTYGRTFFHSTIKIKTSFYFVLCSLIRNFDLWSNLLSLDNKNKNSFYFVLCSLIRNFARQNVQINRNIKLKYN